MRILIATGLYPPDIGGPSTYAKLLHDSLPERGIEVEVVSFGDVRRFPVGIRHIIYFVKLFRLARTVDLVYALDPVSVGLPAALTAKILKKLFIVKIVGDYAWEQGVQRFSVKDGINSFSKKVASYSLPVRFLFAIEKWVAEQAVTIIVPSEYLKTIISKWGVQKSRIQVIYNAFEGVRNKGNKKTLRALLSFEGKLIVSSGRFVPWKGFEELIGMMPKLLKQVPSAKLVIMGDGPLRSAMEKKIEKLNLSQKVILTQALEQPILHSYIRAADVFVLNTAYEGFSHLLLEVMALDVPIVTTNVGGNPELITNGKDGVLVKSHNAPALTAEIKKVLTNSAYARTLALGGKRRVTQFTEDKMLGELIAVLQSFELKAK